MSLNKIQIYELIAKSMGIRKNPNGFSPAYLAYKYIQCMGLTKLVEEQFSNIELNDNEKIWRNIALSLDMKILLNNNI